MLACTRKAIEKAGFKVYGEKVMVNDILFPLPLIKGNSKLGNSVWHSSTLPTNKEFAYTDNNNVIWKECGTCPLACDKCYGTSGHYNNPENKFLLIMRTKLLREYPNIYFLLVKIQLDNENIKKLRIHAVGDFLPGEALGFYNVLKNRPSVIAWTYTKCKYSHEIKLLDSLNNCNIVKSIIPGCGFNFGTVAYIASVYYKLKRENKSVFICRCGIDPKQHCSDCSGCSDHEYVLFIEHSTGYNAKNDYGYNKLVAIIESQLALLKTINNSVQKSLEKKPG